jgi:glycosyltransferase involved in cell wall biosynthesis
MRIAMVAHTDASWTPRYGRYFIARGHDVRVFSFCPDELDGLDTVFVGRLPYRPLHDKKPFVLHAPRVRRLLRAFAPDVVFAPYLISNGLCAALTAPAPLVVSALGSDVLRPAGTMQLAGVVRQTLVRAITTRATLVHAVSEPLREALCDDGVPAGKIRVFPIGVDTAAFKPRDEGATGDEARPLHIVCTRRHAPVYRNHVIVEALGRLRDAGIDFTATFVGGGHLLDERRAQVAALGLAERVELTGFVPHARVAAELARADIYVSASRSDGTSSSLMEALASGVFPVVSDIAANRPWVQHETSALLFGVDDVDGLTEALGRALQDPALRAAALPINRARVVADADEATNMRALEALLEDAVGGP